MSQEELNNPIEGPEPKPEKEETFAEYQERMKNVPVAEWAVEVGKKNIADAEKGDFVIDRSGDGSMDDNNELRRKIVESYPEGENLKKKELHLQNEITRMQAAKIAITNIIEHPPLPDIANPRECTLGDLFLIEGKLSKDIVWVVEELVHQYGTDPNKTLPEVATEIDVMIKNDEAVLEDLHREESEGGE